MLHRGPISLALAAATLAAASLTTPAIAAPLDEPAGGQPADAAPTDEPPADQQPVGPLPAPTTPPPALPIGNTPLATATRLEPVDDVELETFEVPVSVTPSSANAVISEVLYNPDAVYDSRGEWFEIHNTGVLPLDLTGWTFGDEIYDLHTISSLTIAPNDYAVLARFGDPARNGGVNADYVYGDAVLLYNVGDKLVLRDQASSIVDEVDYSLDSFDVATGRSLALTNSYADNADGAQWCLSTTALPGGDLASPGRPNQCLASDSQLTITEIMNNPGATSDYTGEWFEVRNDGSNSVDLDGFTVQDDDGDTFTVTQTHIVGPGEYALFGTSDDPRVNGGAPVDIDYGRALRLHNSFDEIVLLDAAGIQVDAVRYDDGRTFPDPNGASMNLIDGLDNSVGASWCTSTHRWAAGDFGSPGAAGTCAAAALPEVAITEVMFDPERTTSERQGEWFELTNIGSEPAVLDGFVLRTYSTSHTISSLTIPAGERVVLAVNGDVAANGGITADYVYGTDLPLYNTTSTLEVVAPDGSLIDRVKWSQSLGFPNESGHSMEIRSTAVDNSLGANWCITLVRYGDGDFGTPGVSGACDEPAIPTPLVISELMRNPAGVSDTYGEWFEVFNPTADRVDLRNWSVSDLGSEFHVIDQSVTVPAGGYAVIGRSADLSRNGGVTVDYATGPNMVLINSGDELVLSDQYGRMIDQLTWDDSGLLPRPNGGSVARSTSSMRSLAAADDVSSWCTTTIQFGDGDRGTPGAANDCVALPNHAIVINEIHRDPKAEPDAQGEWIELHNTGDDDIDIGGWTLRDDDVDSYVFDDDIVIAAGDYLVAGRNTQELNGGIAIDVQYGVEFIHFNTADEVMLLDTDLAVIDRVAWTATNGFPKVSGATMSLREPTLENAVGANWCAAVTDQGNGDFGTPGAPNACEVPTDPDPTQPTDITHSLFATGAGPCPGDISLHSTTFYVGTATRANHDVTAITGGITFDGLVSYGNNATLGWQPGTNGGVEHAPAAQDVPFGWTIADFAPGGDRALAAGADYHSYTSDLSISDDIAGLDPGVYYVDGSVRINAGEALLNGVTIVATGEISIESNLVALSPFDPDLPTLLAGAQACGWNDNGLSVRGGDIKITGAIVAHDAKVDVQSSLITVTDGAIVGGSINVAGSAVSINRRSGFIRVSAICKGTGEFKQQYKFRVRHEGTGTGDFPFELRKGNNVLFSGTITASEVQYHWLAKNTAGVKVHAVGAWTNEYRGTASANNTKC